MPRSCTRGTDEHLPASWLLPSCSACSRTTARSTPSRATQLDARAPVPARTRCSATCARCRRSAGGRDDPPPSTSARAFCIAPPPPHAMMRWCPRPTRTSRTSTPAQGLLRVPPTLMEPWDGPAALASPTALVGATSTATACALGAGSSPTRARVLASEIGVHDIEPSRRAQGARPAGVPGTPRLAASSRTRHKAELASPSPGGGLQQERSPSRPPRARAHRAHPRPVTRRQRTFGYTEEEVRVLIALMAATGAEPLGAIGSDTPSRCSPTAPAAARLLHAAVRPGDQPAAGLDPRGGRHPARAPARSQPARRDFEHAPRRRRVPGDRQRRFREDPAHRWRDAAARSRSRAYDARRRGRDAEEPEWMCAEADAAIEAGAEFIVLSDRDLTDTL